MDRLIKNKIRKGSLKEAFTVINGMQDTSSVLIPVILRNHVPLFSATLTRASEIPNNCIRYLLDKPQMLKLALSRGLDPNVNIDGISACEMAAKKHMYGSLKELLSLDDVKVSRYVIGRVKNHAELYMLALRHTQATKLDVIYALQIRSTPLLQLCLHKLSTPDIGALSLDAGEEGEEEQPEDHSEWASKVSEILQCPILLRPTAEPCRAPSGHIYDQACIYDWISANSTNPMTREPLTKADLVSVGATILGPELLKGL